MYIILATSHLLALELAILPCPVPERLNEKSPLLKVLSRGDSMREEFPPHPFSSKLNTWKS